jgi:hypothetical protein
VRPRRDGHLAWIVLLAVATVACSNAEVRGLRPSDTAWRTARGVERCVVVEGEGLLVTLRDVHTLRGNVLPPPGREEAVRLAVSAAVARGAEVRGTSPVTHETPDEDPTPEDLAAYGRLVRHMQLSGGGAPSEVAARIEVFLRDEWRAQGGRVGPCGGDAPRWAKSESRARVEVDAAADDAT